MTREPSLNIAIDAHFLEGKRTGVGRYLENILMRLIGHTPHHYTLYFKDALAIDEFIFKRGVKAVVLPKLAGRSSTAYFQHFTLSKALKANRPDVFWGPGYVLPAFSQIPSVLTIHDIIYEARPEWYSWPSMADRFLLKYLGRRSAHRARRILAPSAFTKAEIERYYDIPSDRISVTPLAADERFKPSVRREAKMFKKIGIGQDYVLFVGALFNRRCVAELWQAFDQAAAHYPKLQLVLVGPDYSAPALWVAERFRALNKQLGRRRYVYVPFADTSALRQLYSYCRVAVALSLYEGFGLPPLEAMACGAPVIASATASYPEVVGQAAELITNPKNSEEIARALDKVLADPTLATGLKNRGLKQAQQFNWAKTAQLTLAALENVAFSKL